MQTYNVHGVLVFAVHIEQLVVFRIEFFKVARSFCAHSSTLPLLFGQLAPTSCLLFLASAVLLDLCKDFVFVREEIRNARVLLRF
jgi:hypothetical protein